ncbi:MAG: hypothetical protein UT81_C0014G0024 [Parcubacteria group bacterium GW2011_GWA2_40_14]|nr:MAG: hypothetical protein UT81_C0014G0024 [Parcubacteria group bacterium GW2011_GWA2_40_14]
MPFIYFFVLLVCLFVTFVIALFYIAQIISIFTTDAPFVPIPESICQKIIENLKLDNDSILYDLGCGDARVLREATKKYPRLKAVGVEMAFVPYLLAKFHTRNNKNIEIRRENIFTTNVSNATHVFVYLYPRAVEKLMPILEKKCRPGTRVLSCDFEDKNRRPREIISLPDNSNGRGKWLIVYVI